MKLLALAYRLAERWAVVDVENCDFTTGPDGTRWYDVRQLFDEREHSPQYVDWHRESLLWLFSRGLLARHPEKAHLVRLTQPVLPVDTGHLFPRKAA